MVFEHCQLLRFLPSSRSFRAHVPFPLTWYGVVLAPLVELVHRFVDVVEVRVASRGSVVLHLGHDVEITDLHRRSSRRHGRQPEPGTSHGTREAD